MTTLKELLTEQELKTLSERTDIDPETAIKDLTVLELNSLFTVLQLFGFSKRGTTVGDVFYVLAKRAKSKDKPIF